MTIFKSWNIQNKILPGVYIRLISDKNTVIEIENNSSEITPSDSILLADKYGVLLKSIDGCYLTVLM